MKLHFDPALPHQREAIDAVVHAAADGGDPQQLAVEMETGTGKTYVFIRTALELARTHRMRRFIIVVPSVAIREGVLSTLQATREHFAALMPEVPYRFFAYRRERLSRLRNFVRASVVEFVVLTIDAFTKDSNVLRRPCDVFGGDSPLDALAKARPVVIVDEPHRVQSKLRRAALESLCPALLIRYGATLGADAGTLVHRLDPAQAHAEGLVKTIVVRGSPEQGEAAAAWQIRATIEAHLQRQAQLRARGIKVLSLFFLDRVSSYAEDGWVRALFDRHFEDLISQYPDFGPARAPAVRCGYFATRRGAAIDSKTGQSVSDAQAYDLILKDKPRLLSFEEPVSFVFSHSALREGWDNPNVFQICTLARSTSAIKKRQEIGRGVRLCVDQQGRRVREGEVNVLEVFANESYADYVAGLQQEDAQRTDGVRTPVFSSVPVRRECAPLPWQLPQGADARGWIDVAARRLHAFEVGPSCAGNVLDEAVRALRRATPTLPLRRATILDVIERSGRAADLIADPVRGGVAIAMSITDTLRERR